MQINWDEIFAKHRGRFVNLATRYVGPNNAEDMVQQSFLLAYRFRDTFQGKSAPTTWLHKIVVRQCLMSKRSAAAQLTDLVDEFPEQVADDDSPLYCAQRNQEIGRIVDAIRNLPNLRKRVILLNLRGYDGKEISKLLGSSLSVVKSAKWHGMRQIREQLGVANG
jgi:RNA polymerase sigma-70 factor (ECF subfamily)